MKKVKHTYMDGMFRQLFNDKEKLLELYNAISGKHYSKDTEIRIVTLEEAIFGDIKNDLAFIIGNRLIILIEHQSTINPNMPLRMLGYIAKEYEKITASKGIYSKKLIQIPVPELYVFYNGIEDCPMEQELKLSDAYAAKCDKIWLQAVVKVINVNYEKGAELLNRCRTLSEYSHFIHLVRTKREETGDLEAAIKKTIEICIEKGVLREFLKKNGGDVVSFLYEALSREECEAIREEDGFERGIAEGKREIARKMKAEGLAVELIRNITGLSDEELKKAGIF